MNKIDEDFIDVCLEGKLEEAKALLRQGANIHAWDGTLMNACKMGHTELVKFLSQSAELKTHCDVHFQDDRSLKLACGSGHLDIVQFLMTDFECDPIASEGLLAALHQKQYHVVNYILDNFPVNEAVLKSYADSYPQLLVMVEARREKDLLSRSITQTHSSGVHKI